MWGVPQLPKELFDWMHPVIRDHVQNLQKIAESAQSTLNQLEIDHRAKLLSLKNEAQDRETRLKQEHQIEVGVLQTRVHDLEARFIKDSNNSHKPPSSDPIHKRFRVRSLREKTGRKPGGQPGHRGHFKSHSKEPDEVIVCKVLACHSCQTSLVEVGPKKLVIRQLWNIRDGKLHITEYQAETKRCMACRSNTRSDFPVEAKSYISYGLKIRSLVVYFMVKQLIPFERTQQIFKDLYSIHLSEGTLFLILSQTSKQLKSTENQIKTALINAKSAHFDESGIRVSGTIYWLHVATDGKNIHYSVHDRRGVLAMDDIGILPDFKGVAIHDGLKAYFKYQNCQHGLCNVHHLRELTFIYDFEKEPWAKEMKNFLKNSNRVVNERKVNQMMLSEQEILELEIEYLRILRAGYLQHGIEAIPDLTPSNTDPPRKGKRKKQKIGKNLLERLNLYRQEVLAFLSGEIPFSNNTAEQAIRVAKIKQKISGCFRSFGGAMIFYRLRSWMSSYGETCLPYQA
jgi:transposase